MSKDKASEAADVSVVIPHFNDSLSLKRAVLSVVAQSQKPQEIIVVDDCSDSEHRERVLHFLETIPNSRCIEMPVNAGPGVCRNAGWEAARCEFVAFLDSDDVWQSQKIEVQLDLLRRRTTAVLVAGRQVRISSEESLPAVGRHIPVRVLPRIRMLAHNPIGTSTVMVRRVVEGRFPRTRFAEDYHLWIELAFEGEIVLFDIPLAAGFKRPVGESGLSSHIWRMLAAEFAIFVSLRRRRVIALSDVLFAHAVLVGRGARRVLAHFAQKAKSHVVLNRSGQ